MQSGKIAQELKFVDHKVRTKLDELKREELERLRHLATKEYNLMNNLDLEHLKIAEHLDHSNKHTFEIDDLKKLIAKVMRDCVFTFILKKYATRFRVKKSLLRE